MLQLLLNRRLGGEPTAPPPNIVQKNFNFAISVGSGEDISIRRIRGLERVIDVLEQARADTATNLYLGGRINCQDIELDYIPFWPSNVSYLKNYDGLPYPNFLFSVFIQGGPVLHVRSIKGIGVEYEVKEWYPASSLSSVKLADRQKYSQVTIGQVMQIDSEDHQFYNWIKTGGEWLGEKTPMPVQVGGNIGDNRRDIFVVLRNRNVASGVSGTPIAQWKMRGCFPVTYDLDDLDSMGTSPLLRSLTIQPSSIEVIDEGFFTDPFYIWLNSAYDKPRRDTIYIKLYDRSKIEKRTAPINWGDPTYKLKGINCWVNSLSLGDLDASRDEIFTKKAVITCEGLVEV